MIKNSGINFKQAEVVARFTDQLAYVMSYDQKGHETCNNPNKKVDVKDLQPNFIQIALISNIAVCAITFIAMYNINGFIND